MLNMPTRFQNDILQSGNNVSLIPLVVIEDRSLFFSTNSISNFPISSENTAIRNYDPLLESISGIDSEADLRENSFTISNVTMRLIDIDYNVEAYESASINNQAATLSERLFSNSIINEKIEIYLKSQSAESLDDCLLVYSGYVKSVEQGQNNISLEAEDHTEKVLDKDFINEFVRDDIGLPKRYHNLPVPVVYGFVDKAPCVYYDLYSSLLLTRNRDYAVTPDSFAIQEISNPQIFSDKSYMTIRERASLFESRCSNTLYREFIPEQYQIVGGNRILFSKSPDATITEDFENELIGLRATTTGFNFVEVEQASSPILIDSKYVLHYKESGLTKKYAIADIAAYDFNDQLVQGKEFGSYADKIKIKDWGSYEGTGLFPFEEWFWGNNLAYAEDDYDQLYGESFINFELGDFANETNIVKELLKDNDGNTKKIKSKLFIGLSIDAEIQNVGDDYPELYFQWTDVATKFWDMQPDSQPSETDSYIVQSGARTFELEVNSVASNTFTIGQRNNTVNDSGEFTGFVLDPQGGIIKNLKINSLMVNKIAILNDFKSYDIYANVYGRVDNVQGTYTGMQTLRAEVSDAVQRQREEAQGTIKAPVKPIKKPIKKPVQKPIERLTGKALGKIERNAVKPITVKDLKIDKGGY